MYPSHGHGQHRPQSWIHNSIMIHEILPVGMLQCNCSIVGDEGSLEAIVIDPGDDVEQLLAVIERYGLTVKQIVITHAHIDHIGGAAKLKRITGAPVLLNGNDQMLLKMLDLQASWMGMRPPGAGATRRYCRGAGSWAAHDDWEGTRVQPFPGGLSARSDSVLE